MGIKKEEVQEPILAKQAFQRVADAEGWSTGLWDCCSKPGGWALCCVSCLLPCVQYGVIAEQLPQGSFPVAGSFCGAAAPFAVLDCLAGLAYCNVWPGISLLPTTAVLHMFMRGHIRKKYNIKGSWFSDLYAAWLCAPCALAQETRELVIRGAARDANTSVRACAALPPAPVCMVGNLVMPGAPVYGNAFAPNPTVAPGPHAAPSAGPVTTDMVAATASVVVPATGIPVRSVPTTRVATVTLGRAELKAKATTM